MKPHIGALLIGTGVVGLIGMVAAVDLRAGMVALAFVAVLASLIGALAAFAACAASGRADRLMGLTEQEVRESARRLADECMRKIREDEAERSAAAVIGDDHQGEERKR